jgi:hypothetical protein
MALTDLLPILRRLRRATTRVMTRAMAPSGVARVVLGLWLAIHTVVIAAAPTADAVLGHADRVVAHWEDAQDTSCPPLHDPATCQLCQQVSACFGADASGPASPAEIVRTASVLPRALGLHGRTTVHRGAGSPRGPPAV